MKDSIQERLSGLVERFEEIGHLLSDPNVIGDQDKFRDLSKEYARLEAEGHIGMDMEPDVP